MSTAVQPVISETVFRRPSPLERAVELGEALIRRNLTALGLDDLRDDAQAWQLVHAPLVVAASGVAKAIAGQHLGASPDHQLFTHAAMLEMIDDKDAPDSFQLRRSLGPDGPHSRYNEEMHDELVERFVEMGKDVVWLARAQAWLEEVAS